MASPKGSKRLASPAQPHTPASGPSLVSLCSYRAPLISIFYYNFPTLHCHKFQVTYYLIISLSVALHAFSQQILFYIRTRLSLMLLVPHILSLNSKLYLSLRYLFNFFLITFCFHAFSMLISTLVCIQASDPYITIDRITVLQTYNLLQIHLWIQTDFVVQNRFCWGLQFLNYYLMRFLPLQRYVTPCSLFLKVDLQFDLFWFIARHILLDTTTQLQVISSLLSSQLFLLL